MRPMLFIALSLLVATPALADRAQSTITGDKATAQEPVLGKREGKKWIRDGNRGGMACKPPRSCTER